MRSNKVIMEQVLSIVEGHKEEREKREQRRRDQELGSKKKNIGFDKITVEWPMFGTGHRRRTGGHSGRYRTDPLSLASDARSILTPKALTKKLAAMKAKRKAQNSSTQLDLEGVLDVLSEIYDAYTDEQGLNEAEQEDNAILEALADLYGYLEENSY